MSLLDPRLITGNKSKVETATLNPKTDRNAEAQRRLVSAGELLTPPGAKYIGSAAVHYYAYEAGKAAGGLILSGKDDYATVEQTKLEGMDEGLADFGWKRLKEALMKSFGRTPPRTVTR